MLEKEDIIIIIRQIRKRKYPHRRPHLFEDSSVNHSWANTAMRGLSERKKPHMRITKGWVLGRVGRHYLAPQRTNTPTASFPYHLMYATSPCWRRHWNRSVFVSFQSGVNSKKWKRKQRKLRKIQDFHMPINQTKIHNNSVSFRQYALWHITYQDKQKHSLKTPHEKKRKINNSTK